MISLIEARDFRCLRHVRQPLSRFHVLVGANASGKTTFLDVVSFLADLVEHGPEQAVRVRTQNFVDLVWGRQGESFELAIEAKLPEQLVVPGTQRDTIRYSVKVGLDVSLNELAILAETLSLRADSQLAQPGPPRQILARTERGEIAYFEDADGRALTLKLGQRRSLLANLPADERFPAATWFKALLADGVHKVVLDSQAMRRASPPGQSRAFRTDGSNLPWVVDALQSQSPERCQDWIAHLQTALPDLESIRTVERADDRHRYLMLRYRGGLEVPSWTASDGTLRLLALTLLAYIPDLGGVYLIEEPENGIHPRAIETMYQSLSNVYGGQVLLATHSPIILSLVDASQLLCFAKASDGSTDIVLGTDHPTLKDWQGETNLATLFAAGVLG